MPTRTLDAQVDRLYQLPLDEFTAARNALAKELGKDGGEIRALPKPPAAAWAINQVYWRRRPLFDALTAASAALRGAHGAVMAGKRADLRAAGAEHEAALDAVLKGALEILREGGQPATDATKQTIGTTLRALPTANDPPGRLSRALQPGGFEALAGLPSRGGSTAGSKPAPSRDRSGPRPATVEREAPAGRDRSPRAEGSRRKTEDAQRARALTAAKEAVALAARSERAAEQHARRLEFDAARSAREAERADTRVGQTRAALEAAQDAVDQAEEAAKAATRQKDADARRVRESSEALARARVRLEAAQADLTRLK
jgi:hypothetical protein